jgi:hypothetical protein
MSKNLKEITGYKVAGLTIDIMSKWRKDEITVQQIESFLQMTFAEREEKFGRIVNPWQEHLDSNQKFYKEIFGLDIDMTLALPEAPEDFVGLLYIPQMGGDLAVKAYKKLFGDNSVYDSDYSKNIDAVIKEQQDRPIAPYWIRHRNGVEPDSEHHNKSYDDFHKDGNKYMVPLEGILFALYYRWQTKYMIDVIGITRFHALDSDGHVLRMRGDDVSQFYLDWYSRGIRRVDSGPRQVNF